MRYGYFLPVLMFVAASPAWADSSDAITKSGSVGNDGAAIYRTICQGCHMPNGEGASGAAKFPALAHNPKLMDPNYPAYVVANGFGGMPWFADKLSDVQIAAVVNYVRTHFGNGYDGGLKPEDVAPLRPQKAAVTGSFDG